MNTQQILLLVAMTILVGISCGCYAAAICPFRSKYRSDFKQITGSLEICSFNSREG
jgi:hypothetical protein